jgi:hypothetical protein
MEEQVHPLIKQVCEEMKNILKEHFELEHELVQKGIEIATLTFELGLQKKSYALLCQSYTDLLKSKRSNT